MIIVCRKHSQGTKRKLEYGVKDNEEDDEVPKNSKRSRKDENKLSKLKNDVTENKTRVKKRKEKEKQCDVSHGNKKRKLKKIKESDGNEESDGKENENDGSDASNSSNDGSIQDDYKAPRHSSRLKI